MPSPMGKIKIHSAMRADAEALARELMKKGTVVLDDIGGSLFDVVFDEIYDALGEWLDYRDVVEEKYDTPIGPAYVLRVEDEIGRDALLALLMPGSRFECSGEDVRAG